MYWKLSGVCICESVLVNLSAFQSCMSKKKKKKSLMSKRVKSVFQLFVWEIFSVVWECFSSIWECFCCVLVRAIQHCESASAAHVSVSFFVCDCVPVVWVFLLRVRVFLVVHASKKSGCVWVSIMSKKWWSSVYASIVWMTPKMCNVWECFSCVSEQKKNIFTI